ncbi:MAG: phospholipid scramblase-related protein [Dehalococcoidia bacterium]
MIDLTSHTELRVQQLAEPMEIFTGFEGKNAYAVETSEGETLVHALEESGFFGRQILGGHRPLSLSLRDPSGTEILKARRPHYWFFSNMDVVSPEAGLVGRLKARFALLGRRYDILGPSGGVLAQVRGSMLRPNTFKIMHQGSEMARIVKHWGGLGREAFTKADRFHIEYSRQSPSRELALLLLTLAIVIDLDFFEDRGRKRSGFSVGNRGGLGGFSGRGMGR